MFTGIINGQGKVLAVESRGHETRFRIQALYDLADIILGESIAVNGTCLTVETSGPSLFSAYASAETMQRTALGLLKPGAKVNLERALAVGDRLGGHIVSGHVDCVAEILSVRREGESRRIRIGFPASFGAEVIGKGSVALDGISLTVNDCGPDFLEVNAGNDGGRMGSGHAHQYGNRRHRQVCPPHGGSPPRPRLRGGESRETVG